MRGEEDHKREAEVIDHESLTKPPPTSHTTRTGGMNADLAFGSLVAARLLLSFTPLPDQLKYDHLLSSPLTSNLRRNRLPNVWI